MADGFLGRWAQRKQAVREGRPLDEPAPSAVRTEPVAASAHPPGREPRQTQTERTGNAQPAAPSEAAPPPPTLEDVQALTPQSDFQRFMAPEVDPEVKNAAMKKLFSDPHFNVMDRMDVYIDDYNTPDPMPASMLRKLASAQFLKLFDDEDQDKPVPPRGTVAPVPQAVDDVTPQTPATAPPPAQIAQDHDDTDLRLQQDHAAGPQGAGRGPR